MEFNEDEAIKYIISKLGEAYAGTDEDEILNVIDIIWDYYDENGLLDLDNDQDTDVDELLAYCKKTLAKDPGCPFSTDEIERIVMAELEYEDKTLEL